MIDARYIVRRALARGFDEAVANTYTYKRTYVKIANSKVDSVVEKYEISGDLFVSNEKKVFFADINSLDERSVNSTISGAEDAIKSVAKKEDYNGIAEGPFRYRGGIRYSKKMLNYQSDEIVDIANAAIESASSRGVRSIAGMLVIGSLKHSLATSKGVDEKETSTSYRLSLRAFSERNMSIQDFIVGTEIDSKAIERFAKSTAEMLSSVESTGKISNGKYDIIYMPSPAGSLLSNVNSMACAGSIETGSYLKGKIGKDVANRKVNIYDSGRYRNAVNSSLFDAEGYPTQTTKLISNGTLTTYLHNYSTAVKYKTRSTGNAGLVQPSPNTLVFEHSNKSSIDKLIGSIDRGMLITNTWYTRFSNYLSGDFSTVPRDLAIYIEKGEPKFAVKQIAESDATGIRISDNMIRMLKNSVAASNETRQSTSWDTEGYYYFVPSLLVTDVVVTVAR